MQKNKHLIIGVLIILAVAVISYVYFEYNQKYPSTDDAYVGANLVNVAPKVSGYLAEIDVANNQQVHKGDLLFKINPIDYNFKYNREQKNYDSYLSQIAIMQQQLDVQKTTTQKDQAQYNLAKEVASRYKQLYASDTLSKQAYDSAVTNLSALSKQLEIDNKRLEQYKNGLSALQAKADGEKIIVDNAKSDLNYTEYHSPVNGYVTNLNTLSAGELIAQGQPMFAIVDDAKWFIDANFKETQIARIKPGQTVKIVLDMYKHKYTGVVQSISYASGSVFSLLPAQNATGNWVKVTQRFTVRIKINNDKNFPLRVGASADVVVDTVK
ncbi:MAG: HlyD family secretion protein [Burkholderiales bacterium]|nr:HlyD family secretion protein [Burkholderiales bacterium]